MPDSAPGAIRHWNTRGAGRVHGIPDIVLPVPASKLSWRIQGSSQDTAGFTGWQTARCCEPCIARAPSDINDGLSPFFLIIREHSQPRATHHAKAAANNACGSVAPNR